MKREIKSAYCPVSVTVFNTVLSVWGMKPLKRKNENSMLLPTGKTNASYDQKVVESDV